MKITVRFYSGLEKTFDMDNEDFEDFVEWIEDDNASDLYYFEEDNGYRAYFFKSGIELIDFVE